MSSERAVTPVPASGEQRHESEARFRTMADQAPVLLWMAGTDGRCAFFNQGWLAFRGRTLEEEVGAGWAEGIHPEDFQRCMSTYMNAFVERQAFAMEYRLRRFDGEYRWVYDQGAPRFETDGTFAGFIGSCVDMTEQKLARDALGKVAEELERQVHERTALVRDREALLREVHHRVKNDLQLISSLLNMQGRRLADPAAVAALEECQSRVHTIALIHEFMYQSDDLARLPLSQNIRSLAVQALRAARAGATRIRLEVDVENDITLTVDRAIPCGLILNELLASALKHGFPDGREGLLKVVLRREDTSRVLLAVEDDGVGAASLPARQDPQSLGFRLVKAFAEQLDAELSVTSNGSTRVSVAFALTG